MRELNIKEVNLISGGLENTGFDLQNPLPNYDMEGYIIQNLAQDEIDAYVKNRAKGQQH